MATLAVFEINDYLWNATNLPAIIGRDLNVTNDSPFYPIQQQPEPSNDLDFRPYITYTVRTRPHSDAWTISYDTVLYTVWSRNYIKSVEVTQEMYKYLRGMDETAQLMNNFLLPRGSDHNFLSVKVNDVIDSNPVDQEGGQYGRPFSLTAMYEPTNLV